MYCIYIMFRNGHSGYYCEVDKYDVVYHVDNSNSSDVKKFPTFGTALSHAKWLKRECSNIGRTDVIRL